MYFRSWEVWQLLHSRALQWTNHCHGIVSKGVVYNLAVLYKYVSVPHSGIDILDLFVAEKRGIRLIFTFAVLAMEEN